MLSVSTLVAGCADGHQKTDYVYVHDSCDWVTPIYVTDNDIATMNKSTKRAILTHNEKWESACAKAVK